MLKPRPKWLFFIESSRWVTIYPNIYHPKNIDPYYFQAIVKHEETHLEQQKSGFISWFLKYLFSRSFRLDQEAEGVAAELLNTYNLETRSLMLNYYCKCLSDSSYFWAAKTPEEARVLINLKMLLLIKL